MNPLILTETEAADTSDSGIWQNIINNPTDPLNLAIIVVAVMIILVAIASCITSIYLSVKYVKFNRKENSAGMTGEECARKLLDQNGLQDIKVSKNGSLLFGNSYSHYFHKIRLRRRTWQKTSITSVAMAAEKTGLAVLDKEGDKDMKTRIVLTPITVFGPYAFIPFILIGLLLDIVVIATGSLVCTLIATGLGLGFFLLSFILQIVELKTEVKAQNRAYELLRENGLATEEELDSMKELFKLYNIEYVNNIVLAFLEIVYRILMIVAAAKGSSSSSSSSN